jgi:hypothetical protein
VNLNIIVQVPCVLGTLGLWMQGRKRRIAPALGFFAEAAWIVWALAAGMPGLIPWSLLWAALYARTWWLWGKTHNRGGGP